METGVLIISVDLELAWGFNYELLKASKTASRYLKIIRESSRRNIRKLLGFFERFEIPVTWGVVGHLFLGSCSRGNDGRPHPDMPRPETDANTDWYYNDPCTDLQRDPQWFGADIIEQLLVSNVEHEIASHSFSHVDFSSCSSEVALAEVRKSKDLMEKLCGVTPRCFIFPKSRVGHLEVLKNNGFEAFRGLIPSLRSRFKGASSLLELCLRRQKISKLVKFIQKVKHPNLVGEPKLEEGLWNIPSSFFFQSSCWISAEDLFSTAVANVRRAVQNKALFYVSLHDYSLTTPGDQKAFSKFLDVVEELRYKNNLSVMTMKDSLSCLERI